MKTIASLFLSLLLASLAAAQASSGQTQAATNTQPTTAPVQSSTDSPKPAPEMEMLIKMWAGHWTTVEQFEPSDEMPQGKQDKGAETMRPGPGGLSLIGDYESHGAFFGHLVVTWIPQERVYKSFWLDRTQPGISFSTGRWEGEKLVFTGVDESTGQKLAVRDTYSDITPTSFTDVLETGPVGGPMKRILIVKYTKANDATSQIDPCDKPLTQMEMNQCSGEQYHKADMRLNAVYGRLMKSPGTEAEKQKLRTTEKAWIRYRDSRCETERKEYEGGSMAPMVWADCMTTVYK